MPLYWPLLLVIEMTCGLVGSLYKNISSKIRDGSCIRDELSVMCKLHDTDIPVGSAHIAR